MGKSLNISESYHICATGLTVIIPYSSCCCDLKRVNMWKACTTVLIVQFSSVGQLCPTLCNPTDCSTPCFPVHNQSWSLLTLMSIKSVVSSNHLILCHPLLLPPSIFPSIRVFSNESILRIGVSVSASVLPMNIQD